MSEKVQILYNSNNVAEVEGGKTATLPVAGMKMRTDIEVIVPEAEAEAPNLGETTITPTKAPQSVSAASKGYDGFSNVTVNPIPDEYIIPSGTRPITANGTYDVTNVAKVEVTIESTGTGESSGSGISFTHPYSDNSPQIWNPTWRDYINSTANQGFRLEDMTEYVMNAMGNDYLTTDGYHIHADDPIRNTTYVFTPTLYG